MSSKKENKSLDSVMGDMNKKYGTGSIEKIDDKNIGKLKIEAISTGCPALDNVFGCGGLPRGRIIEVFGQESSGKSTLALHLVAQVQKSGGTALWIDAEYAFAEDHAEHIGVNVKDLILSQPETGEEALDIMDQMAKTGDVDIIVLDSVAALVPDKELSGEVSDVNVALQARMMSKALRMITGNVSRTKTAIVFINQVRDKIGIFFGPKTTTSGGKALKFFASVRLEVRKGKNIEDKNKDVVGNWMKVKAVKNKVGFPFRECEFELLYMEGIDVVGTTLDQAVEKSVITKSGHTLTFGEEKLGVGREVAKQYLKDNPKTLEKINIKLK